ncbi:protein ORF14A [Southern Psittacara leucophthalmus aviadenovirus]|uniref:Protein ORF14A n=1 Tax=Southern Psittacara leucophthalmus aviadenovirus TaxID=2604330 RepID=A0AAE6IQX7_9ADEN|nr:protein ORF14A [Southern Psittacara leucophthalmus aviadenovirus]QEJ80763.2 protein ORF14A [Southern Psittacara leucophthalmus aviadenovirus]
MAENLHTSHVEVPPIFTEFPSSLLFDVTFLEFFMGERMYPWKRPGYVTDQQIFQLAIPSFKNICLIRRKSSVKWVVDYMCTCDRPDSLFCLSLCRHIVNVWIGAIQRFLQDAREKDGMSTYRILDMKAASRPWQGYEMWMGEFEPVVCFHYILTNRYVRDNYCVGRKNNHYYVLARPPYFSHKLKTCLQTLNTAIHRLPFIFTFECYPYYNMKPIFFK